VGKLVQDMVTGVMNKGVGIVATQVGGQWYVSPGRTLTQIGADLDASLTPGDFAAIIKLGQQQH
jgi:hypothetical protein